ncbi:MAG TPA: hypothetical protein P5069_10620, partial [Candidatus Hydrogenedentes bacterium]|nr:hypothetical protein [Candidatus Hydrogenedentota bacterium]
EAFNTFMQAIEQPLVVLFDEFEKVYDDQEQQALLTLLDGVYPSNKERFHGGRHDFRKDHPRGDSL